MPHVLIKYAHVLICISVGKGSRHFSAFHYSSNSIKAGSQYDDRISFHIVPFRLLTFELFTNYHSLVQRPSFTVYTLLTWLVRSREISFDTSAH